MAQARAPGAHLRPPAEAQGGDDGLLTLDLHGQVLHHNPRLARMWPLPDEVLADGRDELICAHMASLVCDPEHLLGMAQATREWPEVETLQTFALRDGRHFERYVSPRLSDGRCIGVQVRWRELATAQPDADAPASPHAQPFEPGSAGALLGQLGPGLRTPLDELVGLADALLLEDPQALSGPQRQQLNRIRQAGDILLQRVIDMQDLAQLESGAGNLQPADIQLLPLLHEVLASQRAPAGGTAPAVQLDMATTTHCAVYADARCLRRALVNLLQAVVQAGGPAARLNVRLQPIDGRVRITAASSATAPAASVEATLGWVIARGLARQMGGHLRASGRPGEPALTLELPAASAAVPGQARGTVLYVDDNEVNRVLMEVLLEQRPRVRLRLADCGAAGLRAARELAPDLLLLDIRLPDMDGFAVLRALRADPALCHLPCLAVSAAAMPDEIAAATAAGFDGYLTKPLDVAALLAELDRRLAQPR